MVLDDLDAHEQGAESVFGALLDVGAFAGVDPDSAEAGELRRRVRELAEAWPGC